MSARRLSDWTDAELKAEIDRFAPYAQEAARRHDEAQDEARLRRAESVSAELARQWPEFQLEITRALAQIDRRLKAVEDRAPQPEDRFTAQWEVWLIKEITETSRRVKAIECHLGEPEGF